MKITDRGFISGLKTFLELLLAYILEDKLKFIY